MIKHLVAIAIVMLMVSCGGDDGTETPDKDTTVTDTTHSDDAVTDTETPDVDYGTGTPGEMVDIPAGEFQMGCNEAVDDQCYEDEYPYHAVTLSAYQIGKYEVTVGEYQQCVTNGACNNNGDYTHYYTNTDESSCNLGADGKGSHPMQCVTWYGAKAYCEWIGRRLPTEAEWEKAARGIDGRIYPWGNEPIVSCDNAVIDDENAGGIGGCGASGTMPVGSKPNGVSPYGAYDMVGSVWELVNDRYASDYYASSPTNNPMGPETGDLSVLRGGAWTEGYPDQSLRTSCRANGPPVYLSAVYGFRCAK